MRYFRVRLRPYSFRWLNQGILGMKHLPFIDDEWTIDAASRHGVRIRNIRTDHFIEMAKDFIYDYREDRSLADGLKHGFFNLLGYVSLCGDDAKITPLSLRSAEALTMKQETSGFFSRQIF